MSPPLLSLRDARIAFGDKLLFEELSFSVSEGDRICLIGRNGSGKSTLFKVITGAMELDRGERFVQPGVTIGYLAQQPQFRAGESVYDYVLAEFGAKEEERYRADQILAPLELDGKAILANLSGGQQRRAGLARSLVTEPELLLLDEPTNHLDIGAILWLEEYLKAYRGALICISHDRAFLSTISAKTFWLRQGRILVNGKGYSDFERWSEMIDEQEAARLQKMGKKLEGEEHWMQRGVTARRKRNMRRVGEMRELKETLRRERAALGIATGSVELPKLNAAQASKMLVEMENISKSFGEKRVIKPFSTRILRKDRIGIIGKNGAGKSTFLNMLMDRLESDTGKIKRAQGLAASYFDQKREALDPAETLWGTLCPEGGDQVYVGGRHLHVVAYLKNFLFDPKQAKSPVSSLSGGEANRLLLAKILANPGNLLVLDEPTNDLDMDTLDMLEDVLYDYPGTLVLVSHDRDFLDRIVTRTIAFEGNGVVEEYVGGYQDYLSQRKLPLSAENPAQRAKIPTAEPTAPSPRAKAAKLSFKYQRALEQLPGEMERLAQEIQQLEAELSDPSLYTSDPKRFSALTAQLETLRASIAKAEEEWLEAEMAREMLENQ